MEKCSLETKFPIHKGPVFPCHFCAMAFINLDFLHKHQIKCIHHKLFSILKHKLLLQSVNRHLEEIRGYLGIEKPPKKRNHLPNILFCEICFKEFSYFSQLNQHVRIHTGEKPFMCHLCRKSFSQSSSLKRHIRTHTGEKPYQCTECNQRFSDPSVFKRHFRTHTGERLFECLFCYKSFSRKEHLNLHLKTHSSI